MPPGRGSSARASFRPARRPARLPGTAIQAAIAARLSPSVSQGHPFARAAVDIALHDLAGQLCGQPIHALLGGKVRDSVPLTFALSIDTPEAMAACAAAAPFCGCFK